MRRTEIEKSRIRSDVERHLLETIEALIHRFLENESSA
jgi:hypothetical protein